MRRACALPCWIFTGRWLRLSCHSRISDARHLRWLPETLCSDPALRGSEISLRVEHFCKCWFRNRLSCILFGISFRGIFYVLSPFRWREWVYRIKRFWQAFLLSFFKKIFLRISVHSTTIEYTKLTCANFIFLQFLGHGSEVLHYGGCGQDNKLCG